MERIEKEKVLILEYKRGRNKTEICKEIGMCTKDAAKILIKAGIKIRKSEEYNRKNWFDEKYFERIDSKEKAYFLGLLYADGNIYLKRNRVQITLVNSDSYLLDRLSLAVRSSGKLYSDREKYSKLILDSKKMCEDLIDKGCLPNKSLVLRFPSEKQVPKELIRHFIRGYFDGDGSISISKGKYKYVNFTSTKEFCVELKKVASNEEIELGKFHQRYKDKINSAGSVFVKGEEEILKLYNYMYKDCGDLFLKRKKEKFGV